MGRIPLAYASTSNHIYRPRIPYSLATTVSYNP
jgi:hypothetical protein